MTTSKSMRIETAAQLANLDFEKGGGLVTVVAQDARTRGVLMVAHADREALERTLASGEMHYRSRSRGAWHKGATSGNVQKVVSLSGDCDGDTVLALVDPAGPACHTGAVSCFPPSTVHGERSTDALDDLDRVIAQRAQDTGDSAASYTRKLLGDRNLRLKKLGEESAELVLACGEGDKARAANEGADLLYHMLVALRGVGVGLADVREVLASRRR